MIELVPMFTLRWSEPAAPLPRSRRLIGIERPWEPNGGRFGAPAFGVEERELGGDLDTAAASRVEVRAEDVGAKVLIALFDQREMGLAPVEGG
jgi:hypothetical protein